MTDWQEMDTAPKTGTAVLALLPGSDIPHAVRWQDGCWVITWDGYKLRNEDTPRYWMPIPPVPFDFE